MGQYKKIEIKGLLVEGFAKNFSSGIQKIISSSKLSEEESLKKIAPVFEKLLTEYEEKVSTFYVSKHKLRLSSFLRVHFSNQKKIVLSHQTSFTAFILYVNGCFNIYEKIIKKINRKHIDNTLKITVSLYGLLVRRSDQILNLLLSGYVDGAMILWRSLYEDAIILLVLARENDPSLTEKYMLHSLKNSRKKIYSYTNSYEEMKFPPLSPSVLKKINFKIDEVKSRFGSKFFDSEYGWAEDLFPDYEKPIFVNWKKRLKCKDIALFTCYVASKFIPDSMD